MRHVKNRLLAIVGNEQSPMNRRGSFMVLAFLGLLGAIGFMALSADIGRISLTRTHMQNAVDAAALAAAQEIIAAVETVGEQVGGGGDVAGQVSDANSIAIEAAKAMAVQVADLNGVYVDPARDIEFGKRVLDLTQPSGYGIVWGVQPYNVVRVIARRDNPDSSQPDARLPLFFAPVFGTGSTEMHVSATAFVEARDIVVVMDFSASMNDDSEFRSINKLSQSSIEDNMLDIYNALGPPNMGSMTFTPQWLTVTKTNTAGETSVTFKYKSVDVQSASSMDSVKLGFSDGSSQTFNTSASSGTFAGTGSNSNETIDTVWVGTVVTTTEQESVLVAGQEPQNNSQPWIQVTFNGTSIDIESTKDLSNVVLEFDDATHYKFDGLSGLTGTFSGIGSNSGKQIVGGWVKSGSNASGDGPGYGERFNNPGSATESTTVEELRFDDTASAVKEFFGLNSVSWPWPSGTWDSFISHCRSDYDIRNAGYRRMYGGACLVDYLLNYKSLYTRCPDLWKTPHYPFHAAKNGTSLFCEFLLGLDFGDNLGLVTYATYSKVQTGLNDQYTEETVDLGDDLLTNNYADIDTIQRHKQAGHFASTTGIGYGIEDAWQLLESHGRYGARPTILLMTDGLANRSPSGWSLPGNWNWDELTDYDGDGQADYTTSNRHKQYAFWQVKQAIDRGITFHTLSVGVGADRDLMEAIAFAGDGEWIDVPGGSTVAAMEEQMLAAFGRIAANVPPAKLAPATN